MAKVEAKQAVVNEIKEKLDKAVSIVLVDARGLTVAEDTGLRKQLREAGVDYKVYKNTMINFAVKGTQFEGVSQYLEGPTAVVIADIPSREVLISKLLGSFQSPISSFARVISQVAEKKDEGAEAAAE